MAFDDLTESENSSTDKQKFIPQQNLKKSNMKARRDLTNKKK